MISKGILGIHHVTAITGDAQRNLEFYVNSLGLRLVKLTVNQDDPTSYHLYYGDELGRPFIGQMLPRDVKEIGKRLRHLF